MKTTAKKSLSILLAVIMMFSIFTIIPITASAAGNSWGSATTYYVGNNASGNITSSNTKDYYKFTLSNSGKINLNVTAYFRCSNYFIYDSNYNEVWSSGDKYWNGTTEVMTMNEVINLTSGTYYFLVSQCYGYTGNYTFKMNFTSANESFKETQGGTNNSYNTASTISVNNNYNGQIANNDSKDYYKFTLSNSGKINLNVTAYFRCSNYFIYDSNYNEVWSSSDEYWNGTTEVMTMNEVINLTSGTYYFLVSQCYGYAGNYTFKMNYTSANESFKETQGGTNNSYNTASTISVNTNYNGQIANNDSKDYYKFTLSNTGKISLNVTAYFRCSSYFIYDSNYKEVWSSGDKYWDGTTEKMTMKKEISLTSGTYYFLISRCYGYTGSYNFNISTAASPNSVSLNKSSITLGAGESYTLTKTVSPSNASTSYTWSSSNTSVAAVNSSGKVTAKATGSATITVKTSNGKTATCKVTVKKAPTSVSLNKTSITIGVGETYDLDSKLPSGCASYSVVYSSNKTSVATVKSSGGLVTGKAVGTATITAKTYNGKTATCKVTVKKAPTSVSLNKTSITIGVGETYDLDSKLPSGCASYSTTYSSNKTSVATVKSAGGLVTGKAVGTATITVKTYNGKTATCKVTVKKAPTSISLNKTSLTLKVGQTYDLNSSLPSGCASYSVKYTSNNTKVATVKAAGGLVTAKKKGTATITATTYNGKKATCKVTVK